MMNGRLLTSLFPIPAATYLRIYIQLGISSKFHGADLLEQLF